MCKLFSTRHFYSKLVFILHFAKINSELYKPLISRHFLLPCYDLFGCFLNISTSDLKCGCQSSAQFGHTRFSSAGNQGKITASPSLLHSLSETPLVLQQRLMFKCSTILQKRFGFGKILLGGPLSQAGSSSANLHSAGLKCFLFLFLSFPSLSFSINQAHFTKSPRWFPMPVCGNGSLLRTPSPALV